MKIEEEEYRKSNREQRMSPKKGFFWCSRCDRCIVAVGEKCPVCGARPTKRTIKKETSA